MRWVSRRPSEMPLGRRLAFLSVVSLVLLLVAVGLTAYLTTRWSLYNDLDDDLTSIGQSLTSTVAQDPSTLGGISAEAADMASVTVLVVSADGVVTGIPGVSTILTAGPTDLAVARTQ